MPVLSAPQRLALSTLLMYLRNSIASGGASLPTANPLPPPKPVVMGPEDLARDALDKAGIAFREDGDYEAYYTALGVVVRKYLADRYDFPAYALTTRELEPQMVDRGIDRWQVRVAGGLFTQCDSVVYARYRPATERAEHDLTAAYEIVEMSRPAEPEIVPVAAEAVTT